MPHAVTHVLIVLILLEIYRYYFVKNKQAFPLKYILIGGIAGLLPDLDVAAYYVLSFFGFAYSSVHRTFSHTLFVPLLFVILGFLFYGFKNKELGAKHLKLRNIFFVIAFGAFMHLILDAVISGQVMPLYPLSSFAVNWSLINLFPLAWRATIIPSIDAVLLVIWLISLEIRHKISSFI